MENISFETARSTDELRISVLLKTVYIQVYGVDGVTFEFANFIEKRFSKESIADIISKKPDQLLIAYFNNNPIGVAEVIYHSTCPIRKKSTPELSKLYVLERFHGKGVGIGLLNLAEEKLIKKGFDELNLEVYIENKRAIAFYEKYGFQTLGEVDFPMEENTYRNLVMNKVLN